MILAAADVFPVITMWRMLSKRRAVLLEREVRRRRAVMEREIASGTAYTNPLWLIADRSATYILFVVGVSVIGMQTDKVLVVTFSLGMFVYAALFTAFQALTTQWRDVLPAYVAQWADINKLARRSVAAWATGIALCTLVVLHWLLWRVEYGRLFCGLGVFALALVGPRAVCTYAHLRWIRGRIQERRR